MKERIEHLGFEIIHKIDGCFSLKKGSYIYDDPAYEDLQHEESALYFFNELIEERHLYICTLEELAKFINEEEDWSLCVNDIIKANGWDDLTGENQYDICGDGDYKVSFDEHCIADVVQVDEEVSAEGLVIMVIKPKHYNTRYQVISGDGHTMDYFLEHKPDIRIEFVKAEYLTKERMEAFGFPQWFIEDYTIDSDFR